jgi:hypothetical protein
VASTVSAPCTRCQRGVDAPQLALDVLDQPSDHLSNIVTGEQRA